MNYLDNLEQVKSDAMFRVMKKVKLRMLMSDLYDLIDSDEFFLYKFIKAIDITTRIKNLSKTTPPLIGANKADITIDEDEIERQQKDLKIKLQEVLPKGVKIL